MLTAQKERTRLPKDARPNPFTPELVTELSDLIEQADQENSWVKIKFTKNGLQEA